LLGAFLTRKGLRRNMHLLRVNTKQTRNSKEFG
jgi:hypothetical protein